MSTDLDFPNNVLMSNDNNTTNNHSNNDSLDDCFNKLSDEEKRDYYNDMVADCWINAEKSNPPEYADCGL